MSVIAEIGNIIGKINKMPVPKETNISIRNEKAIKFFSKIEGKIAEMVIKGNKNPALIGNKKMLRIDLFEYQKSDRVKVLCVYDRWNGGGYGDSKYRYKFGIRTLKHTHTNSLSLIEGWQQDAKEIVIEMLKPENEWAFSKIKDADAMNLCKDYFKLLAGNAEAVYTYRKEFSAIKNLDTPIVVKFICDGDDDDKHSIKDVKVTGLKLQRGELKIRWALEARNNSITFNDISKVSRYNDTGEWLSIDLGDKDDIYLLEQIFDVSCDLINEYNQAVADFKKELDVKAKALEGNLNAFKDSQAHLLLLDSLGDGDEE